MKKGKEIFLDRDYVAPRASSVEFVNEGFLLSSSTEADIDLFGWLEFDEPDPEHPNIIVF